MAIEQGRRQENEIYPVTLMTEFYFPSANTNAEYNITVAM